MDIFFSTLGDYTDENKTKGKPEPIFTEASIIAQKFLLLLAGIIAIYSLVTGEYNILILPLMIVVVALFSKVNYRENRTNNFSFMQQKWLVLNEEIHFLDNEIQVHVLQEKYMIKCAYKEIENLQLCYQDIRDVYHRKASFFTWNHRTGRYKYYFSLQDGDSKRKLLSLLDFFYQNQIPIQEIDDDGNELYLLKISPKKMKVAEEIQDLIDEIGGD